MSSLKGSERRTKGHFRAIISILITILLLLLQLLFYYAAFFGINFLKGPSPQAYRIIYSIVQVIGIYCVLKMYKKQINSAYKLSWTIFILLCPFLGTVSYLFFGNGRVLPKRRMNKMNKYIGAYPLKDMEKIDEDIDPDFGLCAKALNKDSGYPLYTNTRTKFYGDALDKHNDMLEDLSKARKFIFMEFYIFGKGKIMEELLPILENKGRLGIEIKILYDDVGSILSRDKKIMEKLKSIPNLSIHAYEPLSLAINPRVNYRDHRKIVVIDGNIAYTGGDNIADEYIHLRNRFGYWRDNAIRIEGNACESFTTMFIQMWYMASKEKLDIEPYRPAIHIEDGSICLPYGDGPLYENHPSYNLFMNMINLSKKSIFISTPYFIIDNRIVDALVLKSNQGVDVRILIPAIPDKKAVYLMTRAHLGPLLKSGVKVYLYKPGFNHAKTIVVDDKYGFIGTVNMDYRSLLLHFEDGVLLYDQEALHDMYEDFLYQVSDLETLDYESFKNRNIFIRLIELILLIFSPVL